MPVFILATGFNTHLQVNYMSMGLSVINRFPNAFSNPPFPPLRQGPGQQTNAQDGLSSPLLQAGLPVKDAPTNLASTQAQPETTAPMVQVSFGKYQGTGATKEEALNPIRQASYHDIMAHEMAHYNAAGHLAVGGPHIDLDSNGIAVGGHVNIRLGGLNAANPEESYANAHRAMCAACAPSDMSGQDQAVAASASQLMCQSQALIAQKQGWANLMASVGGNPQTAANLMTPPPGVLAGKGLNAVG
jgi:hypothetical protein